MDTVVISGGGKGDRPVGSCGWHQKRVPAVCGVRMRVPRVALEARFLDAVRERQALLARSARRPAAFDREALAAKVEARVRELRSGLGGSSERGRGILRALLGSDRIRVSTEGERGFRLEGTLWLEVETGTAREHEANGRFHFAPPVEALSSTLGALRRAGFEFWAGSERFLDFDDTEILTNLIRSGANVTAENEAGSRVDLRISGSGLRYDDLAADAVTFRLGDVEVRVGRLEKLLRSKELAGRPKHVAFLCLFAARLREEARED